MARLKLLIFSLAVLGLWAAHLFLLSPALTAAALKQTEARVAAVPVAVQAKLAQRRLEIQRLALKVAARTAALTDVRAVSAKEVPSAQALQQLRTALEGAIPAELAQALVLAVASEGGSLYARGEGAAEKGGDQLDMAALIQAGGEGVARDAFGDTYFFYSVPVGPAATVVVGAPLVGEQLLEAVASQAGVEAVAVVRDGQAVDSAGPQQASLAAALKVAPNAAAVVARGALTELGPLKLPLLTNPSDFTGGAAPLRIAWREAIPATPFEVVAIVSAPPVLRALADYQQQAIFAFGGLVLLSLVFVLIIGSARRAAAPAEEAAQAQAPAPVPEPAQAAAPEYEAAPQYEEAAPPEAQPEPPPADDFPFGAPPPLPHNTASPFGDALFGSAPPPAPAPELEEEQPTRSVPVNAADVFSQFDSQQTMAYPATTDPFELAARQEQGYGQQPEGGDFNPEATRVAAIPEDLLKASARSEPSGGHQFGVAAPRAQAYSPPPIAAPAQPANVLGEEAHFQDVFRDFVRTREQCGEPQDGLTFEKFAAKLRKNKEQLVAKYSCRTVRFTVYVKEGKAALKATPVKD